MTTDNNKEPLGRFDAGEPLYIVKDQNDQALSYHRTQEGAEAILQARQPQAVAITIAELHR